MDKYQLKEDEVVLYKGSITTNEGFNELILTNLNIVFINENNTDAYPTADVKIYENKPQVKAKGNKVEIYLKKGEKEFNFKSILETQKFLNAIKKLLTGKTSFERGLTSVKNRLDLVKDTTGIDVVGLTSNITANKLTIASGVIGKIASLTKNKNDKNN